MPADRLDARPLPAFADNAQLRLFFGTLLYLAQGFPQGVIFYAIPNWLAANGEGAAVVGLVAAAVSTPWMAKWAVGAVMDRYTYLPMGRRRPWLIGSQVLIACGFVLFAVIAPPPTQTTLIVAFCFGISALTAIQDVALDALVIDLTPDSEKGRLNGYMFAGKLFGIAGAVAVSGYFMEHHGLTAAMLAMLVLFALPAAASVAIRERSGEKLLPWLAVEASEAARAIKPEAWGPIISLALRGLFRRDTLLVIGLLVGYGVHQTLWERGSSLFAAEQLGWGESALGNLGAVGNLIFGAFCLFVGGRLIDRFGPRLNALFGALGGLVTIGLFAWLADSIHSDVAYIALVFAAGLPTVLFYLSFLVLAMRVSVVEVAATSFALIVATHAAGTAMGGALLGSASDAGGFPLVFGLAAIILMAAGLLSLAMSHEAAGPTERWDAESEAVT